MSRKKNSSNIFFWNQGVDKIRISYRERAVTIIRNLTKNIKITQTSSCKNIPEPLLDYSYGNGIMSTSDHRDVMSDEINFLISLVGGFDLADFEENT